MTVRNRLDLRADPEADLAPLVDHLEADGVLAYPTETVYGLGGLCTPDAVARVQELKRRDGGKPLLVLVPSPESVSGLRWTDEARELAAIFWPGALTLVLEDPRGIFPEGVRSAPAGSVGVRMSPHPIASRLVRTLERPITSTSLNEPGATPAASGREAAEVLDRLGAADVWLLDGGGLTASASSTVVDCTGPEPRVLREGAVPIDRLRCAIPEIHGPTSR